MKTIIWTHPGHRWLVDEVALMGAGRVRKTRDALDASFNSSLSESQAIDFASVVASEQASKGRSGRLNTLLAQVQAQKASADLSRAGFGQYVTVSIDDGTGSREESFVLGGIDESIVELDYRIVSCTSPMGRAVLGKEVGEDGTFMVEGRELSFEILRIEPAPERESAPAAKVA